MSRGRSSAALEATSRGTSPPRDLPTSRSASSRPGPNGSTGSRSSPSSSWTPAGAAPASPRSPAGTQAVTGCNRPFSRTRAWFNPRPPRRPGATIYPQHLSGRKCCPLYYPFSAKLRPDPGQDRRPTLCTSAASRKAFKKPVCRASSGPLGGVGPDHGHEALAKLVALPLAHALDFEEGPGRGGPEPRHFAERGVAEDHVGRHAALLGEGAANGPQRLEQVAPTRLALGGGRLRPGRGLAEAPAKRPRSSSTQARIFSAAPPESSATVTSPRQTSQAPQLAAGYSWPK